MRRQPLSLEAHEALGAELKQTRDRLQALMHMVIRTYGKTCRTGEKAKKVAAAIDAVRACLDSESYHDLGDAWSSRIYYPGSDDIDISEDSEISKDSRG